MDQTMNRKEKKQHGSLYVPYDYYDCVIPDDFPLVPLHWHNEFEISLISEGTGIFRCGQQTVTAHAGDMIILLPNMLHSICPFDEKRLAYDTILFQPSMIDGNREERSYCECLAPFCAQGSQIRLPITKEHPGYKTLRDALKIIFTCAKKSTAQTDLLMKSELLRVFWVLTSHADLFRPNPQDQLTQNSLRPALEYIRTHYGDELSIPLLADLSHLSKSYFMNLFRRVTGLSAMAYVNQIRIQAACELLRATGLRSSDVAFTCGFRNLSNFNRQFHRFTGFVPSAYRKQAKGNTTPHYAFGQPPQPLQPLSVTDSE